MFTRQIRGGFVTSFQVIYDGAEEILGFASAGHPAALHKFADPARGARLLDCGGDIPLGVDREHEWSSETTRFGRNDMLVLYTDGASEARSRDGREFGIEGLRKVVADSAARTPADLLTDITTALDRHSGGTPAMDDCTIVVVQPSA
jgi:sigma-B regulation protein RsbU (phosphoserine phosphatase)